MATWSVTPSEGVTGTGPSFTFPKNTGATNIEYTITYTDDNGCTGSTKYTVLSGSSCQPSTCELYFCNSQGQQTSVSDVTVTSIGLTSTTTHYVDWEDLESNLHYDYVYSTQEPTVDFYIPVSEYIINIPDGYGAIVESVGNNIYKITYWVNINPENNFDEYIDAPAVENQQTVTARITGCNNKTVTRKITKNSGIAAIVEGDNAKIRDSISFNRIVTDSSFYFTFSGPSSNVSFYSPYEIHLGTFGAMDENCRSNIYADTYVYTTTARTSSGCRVYYVLDDEEVRWEISTDQNYNSQQIIEIYPGIDKERHEFMANTIGSTTLCRQFWVVVGCSDEFSINYKGL